MYVPFTTSCDPPNIAFSYSIEEKLRLREIKVFVQGHIETESWLFGWKNIFRHYVLSVYYLLFKIDAGK